MPESAKNSLEPSERDAMVKGSVLYGKYATAVDNDSAYEFLMRRGAQAAADMEAQKQMAAEEKEKANNEDSNEDC